MTLRTRRIALSAVAAIGLTLFAALAAIPENHAKAIRDACAPIITYLVERCS